jgi:folate-binding protein YgfZ
MNSEWQAFLLNQDARVDAAGNIADFGDAPAERRAARDAAIIAPLTHLGLISCSGDDASAFLQGQLSNDVGLLSAQHSQYSSYCSPKGRMLASFLAWQGQDGYFLQLARDLPPAVQKRLGMYIMRAKVKLADALASRVLLGLSGRAAAPALKPFFADIPAQAHQVVHDAANGTLIALPGERFELIATTEAAMRLWPALLRSLKPAGASCWEWLEIRNGLPLVTQATGEQFVPQMANLELIGGVSFKKGCYPGQEIVARTQYRGQLKRRMVLAHIDGEDADDTGLPQPGDALFAAGQNDQAAGMVVNAQAAPDGGCDLLAVVQTASVAPDSLRLGSSAGARLQLRDLPYSLDASQPPFAPVSHP